MPEAKREGQGYPAAAPDTERDLGAAAAAQHLYTGAPRYRSPFSEGLPKPSPRRVLPCDVFCAALFRS
jgi:hypothetical protein